MISSRLPTLGLFALLVLVWGGTFSALKVGFQYAPPVTFTGLRVLVGVAGLLPIALFWRSDPPGGRGFHFRVLLLGVANIAGPAGLAAIGMTRVSAGEAAVLVYTQPLIVAVLARLWLAEVFTWTKSLGLLLGFGGVIAVLAERINPTVQTPWLAYGAILLGAFSWAVGTVYFKHEHAKQDLLWTTTLQSLYGGSILVAVALVVERPMIQATTSFWLSLLFTGLGGFGIAYLVWFSLLDQGEATLVSTYIFLVPLTATLIGGVILGERLGALTLVGMALTLCGIYLANRGSQHRKAPVNTAVTAESL